MKTDVLLASATTNVKSLAGAISGCIRSGANQVEVRAIGAGAVNQAAKSIAIARGFLSPNGINIHVVPSFGETTIDGNPKATIRFLVVREG
jgi:stage V sporulation protein S